MRPAFVILAALTLASTAAAATPIYWAPAKMAKALTALQYPHAGTLGGTCKGIGKHRHGGYTGFRCAMGWQITGTGGAATQSGTAVAWVKPMGHGRICGSTTSLRTCRLLTPGPLAGDPTVCSYNDAVSCAHDAAEQAILAKYGKPQVNLACKEGATVYVWSCAWLGGTATVTFTKGVSAWVTTVTP